VEFLGTFELYPESSAMAAITMKTRKAVHSAMPMMPRTRAGLPKPVLSALIIDAVVFGMMDVAEMKRLPAHGVDPVEEVDPELAE
jgi:hypothetical protein